MANKTKIESFELDWVKTGENAHHDKLEANAFGYHVELYRSYKDMCWIVLIDNRGTSGLSSENDAKTIANQKIQQKLLDRHQKAKSDLAAFEAAGLDFSNMTEVSL
jgi:hypothetical protein